VEALDEHLTGLLAGAPLLAVLGLAVLLGLRHATDPDHLVAVTALVAHERGGVRRAAQLGAWWGLGHASVLLVLGAVLIAADAQVPGGLESGAEVAVGLVIIALAVRVLVRRERRAEPRTPLQAAAIGTLHGIAGTGAIVLLLVAAIPDQADAALALAAFAPMSVVSMTACTALFGWAIARHAIARVAIPALGLGALAFGVAYVL
jgi:hypothetical protein